MTKTTTTSGAHAATAQPDRVSAHLPMGTVQFYDAEGNIIRSDNSEASKGFVSKLMGGKAPTTTHQGINPQVTKPVTPNQHLYRHVPAIVGSTYTTQAAQPVPFYPPDLSASLPKWDSDKADPDNNWILTSIPDSHKNKDPKAILSDPEMGVVFFTPKVFNELNYVVNRLADKTGECAMFICVRQLSNNSKSYNRKPHFLAYDWFLPKQTASSGEVKLDVADSMRYYEHLQTNYPDEFGGEKLHQNLMHAHSHHRMNLCSWSGTDNTQQTTRDELGFQGAYKLFFLFTIGHGLKCTMVSYVPHLSRRDYAVGLCFSEAEYLVALTKDRKKELDERMDALVSKSYAYTTTYNYGAGAAVTTYPSTRTTPAPAAKPGVYTPGNTKSEVYDLGTRVSRPENYYEDHPFAWDGCYDEYTGEGDYYVSPMPTTKTEEKAGALQSTKEALNIFSLVATSQYDEYRKTTMQMVDLLTDELNQDNLNRVDVLELIADSVSAALDKVETSIDTAEAMRDVAPVSKVDTVTLSAFCELDKALALTALIATVEEHMQAEGADEDEETDQEGFAFAPELDVQQMIIDAIETAKSYSENIGIALAEVASLLSMGKTFTPEFLQQLYLNGYTESQYEVVDLNLVMDALSGNGSLGEVFYPFLN